MAKGDRKEFIVDKDCVRFSDKAIQLPVKRRDTGVVVDKVWFPLSTTKCEDLGRMYSVSILTSIYKKKVGNIFIVGN